MACWKKTLGVLYGALSGLCCGALCIPPCFAADLASSEYEIGITDGKLTIGGAGVGDQDLSGAVQKYQAILSAGLGILAITMFVFALIQITKLGGAGDNVMRRRRAINGILASGIAAMLLGGLAVYVSLLWGLLGSTAG